MSATKQTIQITFVHDDDEAYYILPSGFLQKVIIVNESPTDLSVKHQSAAETEEYLAQIPD